jgi:hypothetical protein
MQSSYRLDWGRSKTKKKTKSSRRHLIAFQPTHRLRAWIRLQLELDVLVGYCMRAGYSAIACGLPTPRVLHMWPPQCQQGPHEGSHYTPSGKEPVPEYDSDSDTAPGYNSDSNTLFGFYSDSAYEFNFGSGTEDPESKDNSTEQPLSGPASGMVITSTPAGRFVYWPDRKPADLIDGNSRYIAYLDSLPFQEGTPLARAEEYTPTEVATSDSSLGSPDRQVFMTTNETPGPSGTAPDQYLEVISTDELSANAPADETPANTDARQERNRKRSERRRRLRDSLPIHNLAEALDQVESRVHTTPEQCLMSITTIARQAQGMRAGQVIAKLAEDAYFMRVNTRVAQPPPIRNRDNEATSRSAVLGRNRTRAELPVNPNRTRATAGGPSQGGNSAAAAGGDREVVPHRDPSGGGSDGGSSNHGANRRAGGGGDRGG